MEEVDGGVDAVDDGDTVIIADEVFKLLQFPFIVAVLPLSPEQSAVQELLMGFLSLSVAVVFRVAKRMQYRCGRALLTFAEVAFERLQHKRAKGSEMNIKEVQSLNAI